MGSTVPERPVGVPLETVVLVGPFLSAVGVLVPEIETWHATGGLLRLGRGAALRLDQKQPAEHAGVS